MKCRLCGCMVIIAHFFQYIQHVHRLRALLVLGQVTTVLVATTLDQHVLMATVDVLTIHTGTTALALVRISDKLYYFCCDERTQYITFNLAISGECRIEQDSSSAVGTPTFEGQSQTTYSCKADENCNYDVHVISNYEGNGHTGFRVHNTGRTNVNVRVTSQSFKPLVLVFVSYEPVNWILNIDFPGRVVSKVLLVRL